MADVHFQVLEIEDGFTVLCFHKPPEQSSMRLHCLLGVLHEWKNRYPARVVSDVQVIKDKDIVRSICILWSLLATPSSQHEYSFNVTKNAIEKYGSEYLEALITDASQFLTQANHPSDVAALISKREIVIVVYKLTQHGYVITYEDFLNLLPAEVAPTIDASFHKFKMEEDSGYHVVKLPVDFKIDLE